AVIRPQSRARVASSAGSATCTVKTRESREKTDESIHPETDDGRPAGASRAPPGGAVESRSATARFGSTAHRGVAGHEPRWRLAARLRLSLGREHRALSAADRKLARPEAHDALCRGVVPRERPADAGGRRAQG